MPDEESRLFIEIRGVGPSDFPTERDTYPPDEAVALADDIHALLREEYDKSSVTGVVAVVSPDQHDRLVTPC